MADNEIKQKVSLDIKEHSDNLKKAQNNVKSSMDEMNKDLTNNSKQFVQNESQIKQWSHSAMDEIKKASKAFKDNLMTGAKAMTLDAGYRVYREASADAVKMAFSFSKAFSEIKSRANVSERDLDKWGKGLRSIATDTTANLDSMAESFKELFSEVGDKDELMKIMGSLGSAAAMGDGDVTKVSSQVKKSLQDQGKPMTKGNVDEFLNASNVLRRNGSGFSSLEQSMGAMGSLSGSDIKNSGLSTRKIAEMMAAATKTTGNARGTEAISTLLKGSSNFESSIRLSAGLGLKRDQSGKLDMGSLGSAEYSKKVMSMGGTDQMRLMVIKEITGASDEAAQAFLDIAKKGETFQSSLGDAAKDTETFAQSAAKSKDNLENAYKGMINSIIENVSKLISPLEKPLMGVMDTIKEHPVAMGAAGAGALAMGGFLMKSLTGDLLGKGGIGGAASLAKNVGIGQALKQMGVQPVYVVNASDIGKDQTTLPGAVKDLLGGTVGEGGAIGKAGGMLKGKGAFLGKAGMVGLAGAGLDYAGDKLTESGHENWGHAANVGGEALEGAAMGAMLGSFVPVIGNVVGAAVGGAIGAGHALYKIHVEVDSKDPGLFGRPKAADNPRDAKVQ